MNSEKKKKGKIHMLTHRCTRNPTYTHNYALAHTYTRAGTHTSQQPKKLRRYENHTYIHTLVLSSRTQVNSYAHTLTHTHAQTTHTKGKIQLPIASKFTRAHITTHKQHTFTHEQNYILFAHISRNHTQMVTYCCQQQRRCGTEVREVDCRCWGE